MKQKNEPVSLKKLFSGDTAFLTLAQVFKKKDYNKIINRLRNYQSLTIYLQAPPLSEIQQLQNINSSLFDMQHVFAEIQLSIDEVIDDAHSMGFHNYSQIFDYMIQIIKLMHQFLQKNVSDNMYMNKYQTFRNHKQRDNICDQCRMHHQATHIKKLKTQFGMLYPDNEPQLSKASKNAKKAEKQDLAVKQKQDFIDQINILLQRKDKAINIPVNTRRYKDLVDCLSNLQVLDEKMTKMDKRRLQQINQIEVNQSDSDEQNSDPEDKSQLQSKYKKILDEVKQILNSKFRQGYSNRIRSMLDKFEIVLKNDKTKKIENKKFINLADAEVQTMILTPDAVQVKILREELERKGTELSGLKDGRTIIQNKYMKLLESERRLSKDMSGLNLKNDKLQNQIDQKQREIKYLRQQLIKNKQYGQSGSQSNRQFIYQPNSMSSQTKLPLKSSDISKNNKSSLSAIKTSKTIGCSVNQQTQTIESVFEDDYHQIPKEARRKMLKMFRRITQSSENTLSKKISQLNQSQYPEMDSNLTMQTKITEVTILPVCKSDKRIATEQSKKTKTKEQKTRNMKKIARNKKPNLTMISKTKTTEDPTINEQSQKSSQQQIQIKQKHVDRRSSIKNASDLSMFFDRSNTRRSSRFAEQQIQSLMKKEEDKASRQFKNMNFIRLTEIPNKTFRFNQTQKSQFSRTKDQLPHHSSMIKEKDSIIRINKYQKKDSGTLDRQKVKQIVNLLKMQKDSITIKGRRSNMQNQKPQPSQNRDSSVYQLDGTESEMSDVRLVEDKDNHQLIQSKQSVADTIQQLKMLIEAEYTYLKATGFIGFLLSMQKKPSQINRNLIKYKFQFSHIGETDMILFGGVQEMVRFSKGIGIWKKYIDDQNDLKLYYKHINFAHKISKYFLLLKKMNNQFFQEYTSFIIDPLGFSLSHFSQPTIDTVNRNIEQIDSQKDDIESFGNSQTNWKRIIMRVIRYHHEMHKGCQHIIQFLDKIGYYRYAI